MLADHQKAFLWIAALYDPKRAVKLAGFIDNPEMVPSMQELVDRNPSKESLIEKIKRFSIQTNRSILADIHPDWIWEAIKDEEPCVIALIFRSLPPDKTRQILDIMPKEILSKLPTLGETFGLDYELLEVLQKRLEMKFSLEVSPRPLSFLAKYPSKRWHLLIRDLGFRELAMAFSSLNEKTLQVISGRLPGKDARILKIYMERLNQTPTERLKQAQAHLVSLGLEGRAELIMEAGFFVFSKAVTKQDLDLVRFIQTKFSKPLARLLRQCVEAVSPLNTAASADRFQKEILQSLEDH